MSKTHERRTALANEPLPKGFKSHLPTILVVLAAAFALVWLNFSPSLRSQSYVSDNGQWVTEVDARGWPYPRIEYACVGLRPQDAMHEYHRGDAFAFGLLPDGRGWAKIRHTTDSLPIGNRWVAFAILLSLAVLCEGLMRRAEMSQPRRT